MTRAIKTLCVCQAVLSFGLGLSFPFLAIYLHRERGVPMLWVGGWLSAAVLATALSQSLGGELSDRLGRRRVMTLALWSRAATVAALSGAVYWRWPIPAMMCLHLLSSFVAHFFEPASRGWIADHAGPRERHKAYGWLRAATHGGFAAGPALGGLMAEHSYAAVFALSAGICAFCAAAVSALRDDAPPRADWRFDFTGAFAPARDRRFLRLCLLNALLSVAMAQLVVPLSVYATRALALRDSQVGLLLSLNGLLIVLLQVPATHWLAGAPLTSSVAAGALMYAAGYAWVGAAGSFAALAGAVAVITIGEILAPAAVQAVAANLSPPRSRGRYLGFLGLSRQIGAALGPAAGCAGLELAASRGWAGHWPAVSVLAALAAAGFWSLGRSLKPSEQGVAVPEPGSDEPDLLIAP